MNMNPSYSQSVQLPPTQQVFAQSAVAQTKVVSGKGWRRAKIALGSFSLTVCIVILSLAAGLVADFGLAGSSWTDLILGYCPVRRKLSPLPGLIADRAG